MASNNTEEHNEEINTPQLIIQPEAANVCLPNNSEILVHINLNIN